MTTADMSAATGLAECRTLVAEIGPRLAELAGPTDTAQTSPSACYELIAGTPLPGGLIPRGEGGLGLDFAGYTETLAELSRHNGAAAIGFNMHNVAIGNLFEGDPDRFDGVGARFRDWVIAEITENGALFASASSEPATGASLRGLATTYSRKGDGFTISGHKSFVSLAGIAHHYVVSARPADADNDYEVSHFVVSRDDPGVEFTDEWAGTALRGTATAQMHLRDVPVSVDRVYLGVEGMSLFKAVHEPHWMAAGYLGAYLGLAEAIVDYVAERLHRDRRRRENRVVAHGFGEMVIGLEATRSLALRAARAVSDRDPDANALIHAAKCHLAQSSQTLAANAIRLTGSSAMSASGAMQRLLREVQFCSIMPATPDDCVDYVSRHRLGENMLDVRRGGW